MLRVFAALPDGPRAVDHWRAEDNGERLYDGA